MSDSRLSKLEKSQTPDLHVTTLLRLQRALELPTLEEFFGPSPSKEWAGRLEEAPPREESGSEEIPGIEKTPEA